MENKKTYRSPIIELVKIDRELVLLQSSTSKETPPDQPGPLGTVGHSNSSNPNKFKDNPFEK